MTSKVMSRMRKKSGGLDVNGEMSNNTEEDKAHRARMALHKERSSLVLWRRPFTTLHYFVRELLCLTINYGVRLWKNKLIVLLSLLTFLSLVAVYRVDGPHQKYVSIFHKQFLWCSYWVGLGILSSVGLGTGLHTFLLYLGPHIAAVTLAAFECMSVDFPSPPYPDDIICPETEGTSMSLWTIMSKVRLEAFMWDNLKSFEDGTFILNKTDALLNLLENGQPGLDFICKGAGTAIGELPPYFMARAARLSGQIDEEEQEIEELVAEKQMHPSELSFMEKAKVAVHDLVQRVGFLGILLCASIPNPLFDLAGITCGHFLIPFWTFFGATLIGKAIIKMHIQKLFVIFVFSERHVEHVVHLIKHIPHFGPSLQVPFKEYLQKQKAKLHHKPGAQVGGEASWLSWIFEKLVLLMVVYFVLSIINSMAQNYHKRFTKPQAPPTAANGKGKVKVSKE